jgi:hypothetical protein
MSPSEDDIEGLVPVIPAISTLEAVHTFVLPDDAMLAPIPLMTAKTRR